MSFTSETNNSAVKWSATVLTILGAIFTAFNLYPLNTWAFSIGSILWIIFALKIRENSLVVVNLGLLFIYFAGVVKSAI